MYYGLTEASGGNVLDDANQLVVSHRGIDIKYIKIV